MHETNNEIKIAVHPFGLLQKFAIKSLIIYYDSIALAMELRLPCSNPSI